MTDVHNKTTRSYNMSKIKGKDTKPEILVRKFLFSKGYRYRLHDKRLAGKPDIVLPKYKTVIFIHGCFWHGHKECKYFKLPQTRSEWWADKINKNVINDVKALNSLATSGWKILIVWECELKKSKIENTLNNLLKNIPSI